MERPLFSLKDKDQSRSTMFTHIDPCTCGGRPSGAAPLQPADSRTAHCSLHSHSPHGSGMHLHTLLSRDALSRCGRGAATLQRCDRPVSGVAAFGPAAPASSAARRRATYARSPEPVRRAEAPAFVPGEPPGSKTAPLPGSLPVCVAWRSCPVHPAPPCAKDKNKFLRGWE